jgi:hypothetical protein
MTRNRGPPAVISYRIGGFRAENKQSSPAEGGVSKKELTHFACAAAPHKDPGIQLPGAIACDRAESRFLLARSTFYSRPCDGGKNSAK